MQKELEAEYYRLNLLDKRIRSSTYNRAFLYANMLAALFALIWWFNQTPRAMIAMWFVCIAMNAICLSLNKMESMNLRRQRVEVLIEIQKRLPK